MASSWRRLGAVGGFVGAVGTAFISAPFTVPALATVGAVAAATAATTVAGHVIGRGIEYFRPRRVEPEEPAPVRSAPAASSVAVSSSASSSSSSSSAAASSSSAGSAREGKEEAKDPFGELHGPIRIELRSGDSTASGEHHRDSEFRFAGTSARVSYNLDPWIVGHRAIAQPAGYGAIVTAAVTAWNCNDSIVDHLVNRVALRTASRDVSEGEVDSAHLQDAGRRAFVLHLMALRGNVAQRVMDVASNCPASVMVDTKVRAGVETETIQINWGPILRGGRVLVKAAILGGQRCPGKDAVTCAHDALSAAVATQGGLTTLQGYGLLSADGRTFSRSAGSRKMKLGKGKDLNFAVGHLRFILYLEWRAADELMQAG
jgi:hypothetical protein